MTVEITKLVKVAHISGVEGTTPEHLRAAITCQFVLKDNHMDTSARLELLPSVYYLKDFFSEHVGFKEDVVLKCKKSNALKAVAAKAEDEVRARDADAKRAIPAASSGVVEASSKEQKQQHILKARAALEKNKAERARRRTFNLQGCGNSWK